MEDYLIGKAVMHERIGEAKVAVELEAFKEKEIVGKSPMLSHDQPTINS